MSHKTLRIRRLTKENYMIVSVFTPKCVLLWTKHAFISLEITLIIIVSTNAVLFCKMTEKLRSPSSGSGNVAQSLHIWTQHSFNVYIQDIYDIKIYWYINYRDGSVQPVAEHKAVFHIYRVKLRMQLYTDMQNAETEAVQQYGCLLSR